MHLQKVIEDRYQQIQWLLELTSEARDWWLIDALLKRNYFPLLLDSIDYPFNNILDLVQDDSSLVLRSKLRHSIANILNDIEILNSSDSALAQFFILMGELGVAEIEPYFAERIIRNISNWNLFGRKFNEIPLLHYFTRVMVGLGRSKEVIDILKGNLYKPLYSSICYRGLWEFDVINGVKYLPDILNIYEQFANSSERIPINYMLKEFWFSEKAGLLLFREHYKMTRDRLLKDSLYDCYTNILATIGIGCMDSSYDSRFLWPNYTIPFTIPVDGQMTISYKKEHSTTVMPITLWTDPRVNNHAKTTISKIVKEQTRVFRLAKDTYNESN